MKKRIIVGISGASGFQYGIKTLEILHTQNIEIHLIITEGADRTRMLETDWPKQKIIELAHKVYHINDLSAAIASGSFKTIGMIISPCSVNTLAAIAQGLTNNLLIRAADVILKERRRLVLMVRETPINLTHIRNMQYVTEMGGIIYPPVPALYQKPKSIDEILYNSVARALDLFEFNINNIKRWGGCN